MKLTGNTLPVKQGLPHRERIDELLDEALRHALVTVVAGPGYGKTQAVASYMQRCPHRVIWLHLTDLDNQPDFFWNNFIREASRSLPGMPEGMDFPGSAATAAFFLHAFAAAVRSGGRVVLVADDFSVITEGAVKAFFRLLTGARMEQLCMVLVSSARSDLNVAGMKNGGGVFSISMGDMKFTDREISDFFRDSGIPLSSREVASVLDATDGWPLAVYLLSLQQRRTPGDALGAHLPLVAELFENEYFSGYDADLQRLLIRLSLFPRFEADILKEIGGVDLPAALHAVSMNMFITYDHAAGLFTFQKLYREFLAQKQFLLEKDEVRRILSLAGGVMLRKGHHYAAMRCYRELGDNEALLHAIQRIPMVRNSKGLAYFALDCLESFPDEFCTAHPEVVLFKAVSYLAKLQVRRAKALLLQLRQMLEGTENSGLLGEVYATLGDVDILCGGDRFPEYFRRAGECLPEGSHTRNKELMYVGNNSIFYLLDCAPGAVSRIRDAFFEAAPYMEAISNGSAYGIEWLFAAEAAYYTCDMKEAEKSCYHAIQKAREAGQHDIVCNAWFFLMRIALFHGDYRKAKECLETISAYVREQNLTTLLELRDCAAGWLYYRLGDSQNIPGWIADRDESKLPVGEGRNRLIHAEYLLGKRKYYEALAVLSQMERLFAEKGVWVTRIIARLMEAECYHKTGEKAHAVDALWEAYQLSYHNDIVTPFILSGSPMRALIGLARQSSHAFDPLWCDRIYQKASSYAKRHATLVSSYQKDHHISPGPGVHLTKRETEVLGYLSQGLTRGEIADFMQISINGVSKHITGIYNKLGAINAADAIHIATIQGYI